MEFSDLSKISPLPAEGVPNVHYIAGHMETFKYEEKIAHGFRDSGRYTIPGLVTNVFRAYGEANGFDFVIFDLGCTLTATVKAVLLGCDYIASPFKCERSCVTAAEIVMKHLRDWHTVASGPDECVFPIRDATKAGGSVAQRPNEVSVHLRCHPHFLGAFPIGVKITDHKKGAIGASYKAKRDEVFECYETDMKGFHRHTELTKPSFVRLKGLWIENSESAGREAEGGNTIATASIPCLSLCYNVFKDLKRKDRPFMAFLEKAKNISSQYQKVLKALCANMTPEHQKYLARKSKDLFRAEVDTDDEMELPTRVVNEPGDEIVLPGRVVNVPGDGNCFFHAVVHELTRQGIPSGLSYAPPLYHLELRTRAVAYLRAHPEMLSLPLELNDGGERREVSSDEYLTKMAQDGFYAEGPIIDALAKVLNVHFSVTELRRDAAGKPSLNPLHINDHDGQDRPTIGLVRQGQHYKALELAEEASIVNAHALFGHLSEGSAAGVGAAPAIAMVFSPEEFAVGVRTRAQKRKTEEAGAGASAE